MPGKKRKTKKFDINEIFPEDHEFEDREQDYEKESEEIEKSSKMDELQ